MPRQAPTQPAILRAAVVIALATIALSISVPDIRRVWQPAGTLGYAQSLDDVVISVTPGSAADRAGIRIGDRIDVAAMDPAHWGAVYYGTTALPGIQVPHVIVHQGEKRSVTLTSQPEKMPAPKQALILMQLLAFAAAVGIGATLVILRPSIVTWSFYFYCLGLAFAPALLSASSFGNLGSWIVLEMRSGLRQAGWVGVAVFGAMFLHEQSRGWRAIVRRFAPPAWLLFMALSTYIAFAAGHAGWPASLAARAHNFLQYSCVAIALFGLCATYFTSYGTERQRIRWVVLGFGIGLIGAVTASILANYSGAYTNAPTASFWWFAVAALTTLAVPVTVAYAVIKHRVIDVNFVVSRTLVYTILTTLLVGILSIIDWFFIEKLKLIRFGTIAEIVVAIAIGFWFNGLHKRVDRLIDATFFRQRHRAESQLAQIAASLPHVTTAKAIGEFLVSEPVRILSLASAALFHRQSDGVFRRVESRGWRESDVTRLDDEDDRVLALALAQRAPLSLYDHPWRTRDVPVGPALPSLALPITVRQELAAIVFYGAHLHGEALDPDEIKAISGLAAGAAAAYDHLQAQALQRKIESMQTEIDLLRPRTGRVEILPASRID